MITLDVLSGEKVGLACNKTIKDITISKKLVYTNKIILVDIVAGTNDNWSVDILVEGGIVCEEAEVIAWTTVVLDDTEK